MYTVRGLLCYTITSANDIHWLSCSARFTSPEDKKGLAPQTGIDKLDAQARYSLVRAKIANGEPVVAAKVESRIHGMVDA